MSNTTDATQNHDEQIQKDELIQKAIHDLIVLYGKSPDIFDGELVSQMILTSLKLLNEEHDTGQIKLMTRALKEMRYAYRIFNKYKDSRCISIFGSARTPENHPDYTSAKTFSSQLAAKGWMCITGAAEGIMKAGLEGSERAAGFGLSIRLPLESTTNIVIEGDPKSISFRYFFTRKLMFLSHADAVAAFPGGYGTLDELFEVLTLIQTGKTQIIPIVLVEGTGGVYWPNWKDYVEKHLLANGWISPEDENLFYIASSVEEAVDHVIQFYGVYHSSRYVKDRLVIRIKKTLTQEQIDDLNRKYSSLVQSGSIEMSPPLPEETDHLELPRLVFHHTRHHFGLLRSLIDHLNRL
jgi:uncharacterized protein (TIGR00730 family)